MIILIVLLRQKSQRSTSLWMPGPEDLRDFPVEEELGWGLIYLGETGGCNTVSCLSKVQWWARLGMVVLCLEASVAILEAGSRGNLLVPYLLW